MLLLNIQFRTKSGLFFQCPVLSPWTMEESPFPTLNFLIVNLASQYVRYKTSCVCANIRLPLLFPGLAPNQPSALHTPCIVTAAYLGHFLAASAAAGFIRHD